MIAYFWFDNVLYFPFGSFNVPFVDMPFTQISIRTGKLLISHFVFDSLNYNQGCQCLNVSSIHLKLSSSQANNIYKNICIYRKAIHYRKKTRMIPFFFIYHKTEFLTHNRKTSIARRESEPKSSLHEKKKAN